MDDALGGVGREKKLGGIGELIGADVLGVHIAGALHREQQGRSEDAPVGHRAAAGVHKVHPVGHGDLAAVHQAELHMPPVHGEEHCRRGDDEQQEEQQRSLPAPSGFLFLLFLTRHFGSSISCPGSRPGFRRYVTLLYTFRSKMEEKFSGNSFSLPKRRFPRSPGLEEGAASPVSPCPLPFSGDWAEHGRLFGTKHLQFGKIGFTVVAVIKGKEKNHVF